MNSQAATTYKRILLAILLVALLLRVPGMMWGVQPHYWPHFFIYHPDEDSLAGMAKQYLGWPAPRDFFYPKGFSFEVAMASLPLRHWITEDSWLLIMIGRYFSVIYSVLTVLLLFFIARRLFQRASTALVACAVLAMIGLNVTYAHFAVVDSGVVFWIYATMYFALRCLDKDQLGLRDYAAMLLCCGMSLAFKLSFVALIPVLYVLAVRKTPWWIYPLTLAVLFAVFELASGFKYTAQDFGLTLHNVSSDNMRSRDYNKWLNPVCYAFIIVPLLGLPVFMSIVYGAFRVIKGRFGMVFVRARDLFFIFGLPLGIHLISICSLTFIAARHLLLFTPVFAMLAAAGIQYVLDKYSWGNMVLRYSLFALLAYQAVFVISTEYYFVFDPRDEADTWVQQHVPKQETLALPSYTTMPNLWTRNKVVEVEQADVLVMHEANYGRYLKSIVNPFIDFPSSNQIHHAHPDELKIVQGIFKHELPYRLIKKFEINPVTPEKILYKSVYGNVWPMGDVSIYRKVDQVAEKTSVVHS